MKTILSIVVWMSLLLNVYYYAVIMYVGLAFDSFTDRTDQFPAFFGHTPATNTLLFLALFTLLSIIIVAMKNIFTHRGRVVFSVAQTIAFAFYLWQLM